MAVSPSRYCVVSMPLSAVCSEIATSWLVTPARRARGWSTATTSFLLRMPQSSVMPAAPGRERISAFTRSASSNSRSGSRPASRTWTGALTGGPSCSGSSSTSTSGYRSRQKAAIRGINSSVMTARSVALNSEKANCGLAGCGLWPR